MDIDRNAPVITIKDIFINAPIETVWKVQTDIAAWPSWQMDIDTASIGGELAAGITFHWQTSGLSIDSTIQEVDPPHRIAWGGPSSGIEGLHFWTFRSEGTGTLVHTEESWDGEPIRQNVVQMQQALDKSLQTWLENLKKEAESKTK